jgi:hypothetical protein
MSGKYDELQSQYKSMTKVELVDELRKQGLAYWEQGETLRTKLEKLEEQRAEYQHLAESVIAGVRDTLNNDTKLYGKHHNTYYALWYWVEWGTNVIVDLKNSGGDK